MNRADKLKEIMIATTAKAGEPPLTPEDEAKLTAIAGALVEAFDILTNGQFKTECDQ